MSANKSHVTEKKSPFAPFQNNKKKTSRNTAPIHDKCEIHFDSKSFALLSLY
jgi:hypothetical protein